MTDLEFKELGQLKEFCLELQKNPMWANLCEYVQRKRIDPIEDDILNATLNSMVPTFEFLCYNDAKSKGKILGIREFMDVVPTIILKFNKELDKRNNPVRKIVKGFRGAGSRKP